MEKSTLYRLVDQLPETEMHTAKQFLEFLLQRTDPVWQAMRNAPLDDEPLTEDEEEDIRQAREEYSQGKLELISMDEVKREFELS